MKRGQIAHITLSEVKNEAGDLTDPTKLTLEIEQPSGEVTVFTWPEDAEIKHPSTGNFSYNLNLAESGIWEARWFGTGAVQVAETVQYEVEPDAFEGPNGALVTLTEARTYLGVGESDKPTGPFLRQVILGLSARIVQHTGRTYLNPNAEDASSARQFLFDPAERVLRIDDCRDIETVEVSATPQDDKSWDAVETELWVAEPLGKEVVDRLRFLQAPELPATGAGWSALGLHASIGTAGGEQTLWPHQVRTELSTRVGVQVAAKWGYGPTCNDVPANAKLALLMWLQNIHKRDKAFFSDQAKVWAKMGMPEDVRELLDGEGSLEPGVLAV